MGKDIAPDKVIEEVDTGKDAKRDQWNDDDALDNNSILQSDCKTTRGDDLVVRKFNSVVHKPLAECLFHDYEDTWWYLLMYPFFRWLYVVSHDQSSRQCPSKKEVRLNAFQSHDSIRNSKDVSDVLTVSAQIHQAQRDGRYRGRDVYIERARRRLRLKSGRLFAVNENTQPRQQSNIGRAGRYRPTSQHDHTIGEC